MGREPKKEKGKAGPTPRFQDLHRQRKKGEGNQIDIGEMELHDPEKREPHDRVGQPGRDEVQREHGHGFHKTNEKEDGGKEGESGIDDGRGLVNAPGNDADPGEKPREGDAGDPFDDVPSQKSNAQHRKEIQKDEGGLWYGKDIKRDTDEQAFQGTGDLALERGVLHSVNIRSEIGPSAGGVTLQTDQVGLLLVDFPDLGAEQTEHQSKAKGRCHQKKDGFSVGHSKPFKNFFTTKAPRAPRKDQDYQNI